MDAMNRAPPTFENVARQLRFFLSEPHAAPECFAPARVARLGYATSMWPIRHELPILALVVACAPSQPEPNDGCGQVYFTRTDPGTDLSAIMTFAILPETQYPTDLPDDLPDDAQISLDTANAAAREQLLERGLTEVDPEQEKPDVWLFSLAATQVESGVVWTCVPSDPNMWWGPWGWTWNGCAWLTPVAAPYEVGTVMVGLADPDDETIVFGGVIQGVLGCPGASARLERAIERVFEEYPG
jgi:hypothetical protein